MGKYGAIIEKGPSDWQIIQQHDGFGETDIEGRIIVEDEIYAMEDLEVVIRVTDENTNSRIIKPIKLKPEDNRFKARIKIPAGGPYRIESYLRMNGVWEKRGDRRFHIGVGDIFVIAGQSNAAGIAADCVSDPVDISVHAFRHCGRWDIASHPLCDGTDSIYSANFERVRAGHSPWIAFGKILAGKLGYPIGLIPAALGGAPLSYWNRLENGFLFDNMLKMIEDAGGEVAGMLWYQGCNDTLDSEKSSTYLERFKCFCEDFRSTCGSTLPIFTVQLNKAVNMKDADIDMLGVCYASIREAQRRAALEIKELYMVPSIDLPVCDGIHNSAPSNLAIGQRAADTALKYMYGREVVCEAPQINKIVHSGEKEVTLYFDFVFDRIYNDNNPVETLIFSLSDDNGRIFPTDYDTRGDNSIILYFEREIGANATVSCDRYNDHGLIPYDQATHLPIIPFCKIPVLP